MIKYCIGLNNKNFRCLLMAAILLFLLSSFSYAQVSHGKIDVIVNYADKLSYPEFSGVVLIAEKDTIHFEKTYGYASLEYGVKNQPNTLFNIASITKAMTAASTLQLVDRGLLDLDVPVGKYLPDYPNKTVRDSVTAYQLLTHTSGLNNFLVDDFKSMGKLNLREVKDYLPLFSSKPLMFSPGSKYSYSAAGYVVLGLLIERLSGENYHQYLKDKVFDKAGMKNTLAIPIDSIVKNKASGYTSYFGESDYLTKNDSFLGKANPAGFYYSTASDLFVFFEALKGNSLLSEQMTKTMMSPLVKGYYTNYGFGLSVDKRFDQTIVGHTGGWYGVQCELMYFEKDEITVVILSNVDTAEGNGMNKISNFVKHILANKPLP